MEEKNETEKTLEELKSKIDQEMEKVIPKNADNNYLERVFGRPRYAYDLSAINNALNKPVWDFLDRGGKRWRPAMFLLIAEALGGDTKKLQKFAVISELVHSGSVITDDVEDDGELRRDKPCTHKIFGVDVAINAGNFLYFLPLMAFLKNRNKLNDKTLLRAYEIYAQEMTNIHAGQAMDIWWHKGNSNPTESQYMQMCACKTGTLARMSARLAVALSEGSAEQEEKMGRFAESIGIAFQIQDDILDIISSGKDRKKFGKAFGNDIKEGKRTLMVIHTLEKASESDRERLLKILNSHTSDPKLVQEAISILQKYGSVQYTKQKAKKLVLNAWKEVDPLLKDSKAKKRLRDFAYFLIERDF
ncbi:MAG: polyprenyl synthetase family protein [Candidatus Aenigmarchaeota archaeon]|nr:polyprenyl synthetase family protein [Candidatus Aenigmarchaeota archaeon]